MDVSSSFGTCRHSRLLPGGRMALMAFSAAATASALPETRAWLAWRSTQMRAPVSSCMIRAVSPLGPMIFPAQPHGRYMTWLVERSSSFLQSPPAAIGAATGSASPQLTFVPAMVWGRTPATILWTPSSPWCFISSSLAASHLISSLVLAKLLKIFFTHPAFRKSIRSCTANWRRLQYASLPLASLALRSSASLLNVTETICSLAGSAWRVAPTDLRISHAHSISYSVGKSTPTFTQRRSAMTAPIEDVDINLRRKRLPISVISASILSFVFLNSNSISSESQPLASAEISLKLTRNASNSEWHTSTSKPEKGTLDPSWGTRETVYKPNARSA
mmetsp:Transcript_114258/g.303701  ORF Transcript_114258/g.303701 Transcript_114258/m.303701 type:complete len:333 (-) Transcript_114258:433-1431(-)